MHIFFQLKSISVASFTFIKNYKDNCNLAHCILLMHFKNICFTVHRSVFMKSSCYYLLANFASEEKKRKSTLANISYVGRTVIVI